MTAPPLAGLPAGYDFGVRLRAEVEWFHRESEYDQAVPVSSSTGDTFAKLGGEMLASSARGRCATCRLVLEQRDVEVGVKFVGETLVPSRQRAAGRLEPRRRTPRPTRRPSGST